MEMLFTGRPITAQEALLHGLVSKVVREECLEEETLAIARRICDSSRPVVALGKAAFQRQMAQARDAAYATATAVMVDNLALRDGQEGIQAFLEKRRPLWTNSTEKARDWPVTNHTGGSKTNNNKKKAPLDVIRLETKMEKCVFINKVPVSVLCDGRFGITEWGHVRILTVIKTGKKKKKHLPTHKLFVVLKSFIYLN